MNELTVNFKKVKEDAIVPTRGSKGAAGLDLYACIDEDIHINPGCKKKIPTGIAMKLNPNTFGMIVPRSGLSTKEDLANINAPGICDEDYVGELIVALHNYGGQIRVVHPQERIAQLLVLPYYTVNLNEVDELEETERGDGGFGSTGKY